MNDKPEIDKELLLAELRIIAHRVGYYATLLDQAARDAERDAEKVVHLITRIENGG